MKRYTVKETDRMPVGCYDCGLPYDRAAGWIETSVPDEIWDTIKPTEEGDGLLCISCIARRCVEAGLENVPVRLCGTEPLVTVDAFPFVVRCKRCQSITHLIAADLSPLQAQGWHYEAPFGWVCPKHRRRSHVHR